MTHIKVRQESFPVDYRSESLPPLFFKQESDCDFTASNVLEFVHSSELISVVSKARLTLLLACDQLKEQELIQALQETADRGVRIYLLLGDPQSNKSAIDALSGRCLIRTNVQQQGVLMLADHTTTQARGVLITGPNPMVSSESGDWGIQLEQRQIEDGFRSFCKLFWEDADQEYLQQNQAQQTVGHPDGTIVTNHSYQLPGMLEDGLAETRTHLSASSNIVFGIEGGSHQLLLNQKSPGIRDVARQGVSLTESPIPTMLFSVPDNWLLPESPNFAHANWCLKLSNTQHRALSSDYEQARVDASWQFQSETALGDFPPQQFLRFIDQPDLVRSVEPFCSHTLEDISTDSIDSFLEDDAEDLASSVIGWQRDRLAHQIDYHVTIHPPYCPPGASKDALYSQWQRAEDHWQDRLSSLERLQKKIAAKQDSIAGHLKNTLEKFLLGQTQSVKGLNQELEALKSWSVREATPAEREEKKQHLEALLVRINQQKNETAEKLDEAEQRVDWQEKQQKLEAELEETTDRVQSKTDFWQELSGKREEDQQRIEQAFLATWEGAAKKLDEQKLKEGSQTREALQSMSAEQAEQWRVTFKSNKVWKKHYSAMEKALEDRRLALAKLERDIQEAKNAAEESRSDRDRAQDKLDTHGKEFIYRPRKQAETFDRQLGLTNDESPPKPFTWPNEELPTNGVELRSQGQQRYLVIKYTDQLEQAREDADRLNARIVCNRESANA